MDANLSSSPARAADRPPLRAAVRSADRLPSGAVRPQARVLVVDDERAIMTVERDILLAAGYETRGVQTPQEALSLAHEGFDALVTDYSMPEVDGLDLFRRYRELQPRIVGVLVTGYGTVDLVQTAMRAGFSAILLKPFPLEALSAAVQRALRQRDLAEENQRLTAVLDAYVAAQELNHPRSRRELAGLLGNLARRAAPGAMVAVLLVESEHLAAPSPDEPAELADLLAGVRSAALSELTLVTEPHHLLLPLRWAEEIEGLLAATRSDPAFETLELERLSLLANQAALALTNTRLFEERLREEKLAVVGRVAGAVCHRLREPIQGIRAAIDGLVVAEQDYLEMIGEQVDRLDTMAQELSDFCLGRESLERVPYSLAALLRERARPMHGWLAERGIDLDLDCPGDVTAPVDVRKISRVIENLAKNAAEAMPDGGRLRLGLAVDGPWAVVTVADTGKGMAPEVAERLWEPFFTHGKLHGTGLGGAVVRSAIEAHGGQVEVDSEVGRGTTIRLRLPLTPSA